MVSFPESVSQELTLVINLETRTCGSTRHCDKTTRAKQVREYRPSQGAIGYDRG